MRNTTEHKDSSYCNKGVNDCVFSVVWLFVFSEMERKLTHPNA